MKDLNKQLELDLSVFDLEFDTHHRGKQCVREIQGLRENRHPSTGKKISSKPFTIIAKSSSN